MSFVMAIFAGLLVAIQISTLKVDVKLAQVIATITDRNARYVSDLTSDDFILEENGAIQEISHFSHDPETPLSLGILVDTSSSMSRSLPVAIGGAKALIRSLRPADEVQIMSFDSDFRVAQQFTTDRQRADNATSWLRIEGGGTYLLDAVVKALSEMKPARNPKRVLIIISDGGENWHGISLETLRSSIHAADILIYPIAILPQSVATTGPQLLMRLLAVASGGRDTIVYDERTSMETRRAAMEKLLAGIQGELREQYTLGYYPAGSIASENRRITVRVKRPGLVLRIREDGARPPKP